MNCTVSINYLYAIADSANQLIKIGYAKDPEKRCAQLQTGNPTKLSVVWKVEVDKSRAKLVETKIHKEYNYKRVRGEWFKMTAQEATDILNYAFIRWCEDPLL